MPSPRRPNVTARRIAPILDSRLTRRSFATTCTRPPPHQSQDWTTLLWTRHEFQVPRSKKRKPYPPGTWNLEPGTWNLEPGTWNLEPGTWNLEPGTRNLEPGTWNPEPGTRNPEPRT